MCEVGDWDSECLRKERVRARKPHRCAECGGAILPGTEYVITAMLTDHHVGSYKNCLTCARIEEAHFSAERALGTGAAIYVIGDLREQIRECIQEEPHYVVAFRAAWKGQAVPKKPRPIPQRGVVVT